MKTEDVRATEIAITPYLTLILFSIPAGDRTPDDVIGSSVCGEVALAGLPGEPRWSLPPLVRPQDGPMHV